jgi:imidazolonepropionase-like amidohydrolase
VVVERGKIICVGPAATCSPTSSFDAQKTIDLHGGSISPGFMSFGSALGLEEISGEPSTADGPIHDAFVANIPSILGDSGGVMRAMDALKFQTRNALLVFHFYSFTELTS